MKHQISIGSMAIAIVSFKPLPQNTKPIIPMIQFSNIPIGGKAPN
jgi:uncharacterized protein (DUF697 family)